MDAAFKSFFLVCIIVLAVLTFFCLVRTIKGPRLVDRIVGTNMIGTMTIAIIALLAAYLNESSILDICLIYAIMSFVAVIVTGLMPNTLSNPLIIPLSDNRFIHA